MSLRTLIVDDEPLAIERLRFLLSQEEDVQIVAECANGPQAIAYLQTEPVDLIFLDIEMPMLNGIEVLKQIGENHTFATILVTAYPEHAADAFEHHALDYVTKPVKQDRLRLALKRARARMEAQTALSAKATFTEALETLQKAGRQRQAISRILVRDGVKDVLLRTEAIEWIESANYYSSLHSKGRTYLIRETTSQLSEKLDPGSFIRIHRSAIINLRFVKEIYREGPDEGTVVMLDGKRFSMSKAGRQRLLEVSRL